MELSIVVAVYGVEKYIDKCMQSIVSQLRNGVEVIVVSDHSQDRSVEICAKYAVQYPDVRIVEHERNRGISAVRNTGISQAKGKYCWFVDGDDCILPGAVDAVLEQINAQKEDVWLMGHERLYAESGSIRSHVLSQEHRLLEEGSSQERMALLCDILKNRYGFEVWNKIFSLELIRQHDIRFPEMSCYGEDLAFLLCYMQHCRTLAVNDRCIYRYVIHEQSMMAGSRRKSRFPEMIENAVFVWENISGLDDGYVICGVLLAQGIIQSWKFDILETVRLSRQKEFLKLLCKQITGAPFRMLNYYGKRFSAVTFFSALLINASLNNNRMIYRLMRFLLYPMIRKDILH